MKNKLQTLKKSIFSSENTSTYTITLVAFLLFTLYTTAYALTVFKQFTWIEIISVSVSFIIILLFSKNDSPKTSKAKNSLLVLPKMQKVYISFPNHRLHEVVHIGIHTF